MKNARLTMANIINCLEVSPRVGMLLLTLPLALWFNQYATQILNASYQASLFPVPYYVGQLAFDAAQLKSYYSVMLQQGSLDIYVQTQIIDFVFILSTLLLHGVVTLLLARLQPQASRLRRAAFWLVLVAPLAPVFDSLENLVSFVMLANPLEFSAALALIYSGFAAAKFAVFVVTYLGAVLFLVTGIGGHAWAFVRREKTVG